MTQAGEKFIPWTDLHLMSALDYELGDPGHGGVAGVAWAAKR
jgi:hypothetical protein